MRNIPICSAIIAACVGTCALAQPNPQQGPALLIACLEKGSTPPAGFLVIDKRLLEAHSLPTCPQSTPIPIVEKGKVALLSGTTVIAGHKMLQFSHDSKPEDIHRVLAMYSVPQKTIDGLSPRISNILTSSKVRKGIAGIVAIGIIAVGVDLFWPATPLVTPKPPLPSASGVVIIESLPAKAASQPIDAPNFPASHPSHIK